MKKIMILTSAAILTGCGLWKPYAQPEVRTAGLFGERYESADTATLATLRWQEMFTDPYLQKLIREGLDNNADLHTARLRIGQAEAALQSARLSYYPSFYFTPEGALSSFDTKRTNKTYTIPVTVSWEIDAFGKLTNAKRRSRAAYEQSLEYRQAVQTWLIATIANHYYTLLMLDKQYEISVRTAENWKESIGIMRAMKEAGMFDEAAIAQNEAVYFSIEASLYDLREQINQVENALSTLLFDTPHAIGRGDLDRQILPGHLAYGVPVQLLANRPDVRMAEYDLIQAYYSTAEARSNLYPSLVLGGSAGWTNSAGSMIVNPGKLLLTAAGSLAQPIFNRKLNRNQLRIAELQQEQAAIEFQQTLLNAGAEVNNALMQYQTARDKRVFLARQVESLERAVESTGLLMTHGSTTYLEVLTARQSLLSAELAMVADRFDEIQGIISLYHALGGGTNDDVLLTQAN